APYSSCASRFVPPISCRSSSAFEESLAAVREPRSVGGYVLEREVHAGQQSSVFFARPASGGEPVAVKMPRGSGGHALRRFAAEVSILDELRHPAIVRLLESGGEGPGLYAVLEWIEGESLLARLARGRLPLGESVALARRIAEGLAVAHRAG